MRVDPEKFLELFFSVGKGKDLTLIAVGDGNWELRGVESKVKMPVKEWYNLTEAFQLKGVNYKTVCNKPYLKPNNGVHEGIVA